MAVSAPTDLIQGTKAFGPPATVAGDIDHRMAEMVNFLFDKGMCEADIAKRPKTTMLLPLWNATHRCWRPLLPFLVALADFADQVGNLK